MPDTFITWKWPPPKGYRSTFGPDTVNVLRRMIQRNYPLPHRFCVVTAETQGLDPAVEVIPPWNDYADLPSPSGGKNPSCYRRLRMFAPDIESVFGKRFVSLDLDMVITGDLTSVFDRPEDFVIWGDTNPRTFYNGSFLLMSAGARAQVWTQFDPVKSPRASKAAGHHGSDQGWLSHCLGPNEAKWTTADGVYSFRNHLQPKGNVLPANAKVVIWHGEHDPWGSLGRTLPWVQECYR